MPFYAPVDGPETMDHIVKLYGRAWGSDPLHHKISIFKMFSGAFNSLLENKNNYFWHQENLPNQIFTFSNRLFH